MDNGDEAPKLSDDEKDMSVVPTQFGEEKGWDFIDKLRKDGYKVEREAFLHLWQY